MTNLILTPQNSKKKYLIHEGLRLVLLPLPMRQGEAKLSHADLEKGRENVENYLKKHR